MEASSGRKMIIKNNMELWANKAYGSIENQGNSRGMIRSQT
jgi:hypothetical protein